MSSPSAANLRARWGFLAELGGKPIAMQPHNDGSATIAVKAGQAYEVAFGDWTAKGLPPAPKRGPPRR